MENRAHALIAGAFTLLLSLALVMAVWWLTGSREATREAVLVAGGSINGLNTQAQVRFRGLRVGKVLAISIDPLPPYRILVRVSLSQSVPLTSHTTAQVNSQGVTGLAFVQLDDDGAGTPVAATASLPHLALRSSSLDGLSSAAGDVASQIKLLTSRLNRLLDDANLARIERTLAHLEGATLGMDKTLQAAPKLLADLRKLVNEENLQRLGRTLANLERSSAEAPALVAEARRALESLQTTSQRIDALGTDVGGEVSQTTLPRLNHLLQDLTLNSRQLSRVLDQLQNRPQSLLFGSGGQRPEPGEPGFKGE